MNATVARNVNARVLNVYASHVRSMLADIRSGARADMREVNIDCARGALDTAIAIHDCPYGIEGATANADWHTCYHGAGEVLDFYIQPVVGTVPQGDFSIISMRGKLAVEPTYIDAARLRLDIHVVRFWNPNGEGYAHGFPTLCRLGFAQEMKIFTLTLGLHEKLGQQCFGVKST